MNGRRTRNAPPSRSSSVPAIGAKRQKLSEVITIRLPYDVAARLRERCGKRAMSGTVRLAIENYLCRSTEREAKTGPANLPDRSPPMAESSAT